MSKRKRKPTGPFVKVISCELNSSFMRWFRRRKSAGLGIQIDFKPGTKLSHQWRTTAKAVKAMAGILEAVEKELEKKPNVKDT